MGRKLSQPGRAAPAQLPTPKAFVALGTNVSPVEIGSPCLPLATGFQAEMLQWPQLLLVLLSLESHLCAAGMVGKAVMAQTGDLGGQKGLCLLLGVNPEPLGGTKYPSF